MNTVTCSCESMCKCRHDDKDLHYSLTCLRYVTFITRKLQSERLLKLLCYPPASARIYVACGIGFYTLKIFRVTIIHVENFSRTAVIESVFLSTLTLLYMPFFNTPTQLLQENSSCCGPTMVVTNVSTVVSR